MTVLRSMLSGACSRKADAVVTSDGNIYIYPDGIIKVDKLGRSLILFTGRVDVQCNLCESEY